ncbi:MAG: transposase [Chloroflexota bacterium]|nr:transposase [Chloroflexota bacterium]
MSSIAAIVRRFAPAYRSRFQDRLLPSHVAALQAIDRCRTAALGGHVATCPTCAVTRYQYHSCRHRHCPACQQDHTQRWLAQQQALLLPVPYFLVTFTVPAALRDLFRQHQRQLYQVLFRASATALQQLAADPRFLGGQIGLLGVLQTWTRDLRYHPHIHYLVPAVSQRADGQVVVKRGAAFLVPVKPLAILFRAKFRAALRQLTLADHVPTATWSQSWVVDCRPVGDGRTALTYLAPYVVRGPLANNRIVAATEDAVTFWYRDGTTKRRRTCTLRPDAFLHRFLQHVLPPGFVKVRRFGLFAPHHQPRLRQIRAMLALAHGVAADGSGQAQPAVTSVGGRPPTCPVCGRVMELRLLLPTSRSPPPQHSLATT